MFFGSISIFVLDVKVQQRMTFKRDNIDRVSVARKLINMPHVSQEKKNVHLWLMPVLQRGSSIKVGDIDFISWFFLQAWPR